LYPGHRLPFPQGRFGFALAPNIKCKKVREVAMTVALRLALLACIAWSALAGGTQAQTADWQKTLDQTG
jgi:ABC-type antimicrobial peptide transport system permease subunit